MLTTRPAIKGLYAITADEPDTIALLNQVRSALDYGVRILQYRNKAASPALLQAQAMALRTLTRAAGCLLIINDNLPLCLQVAADGVHLGRDDIDLQTARTLLGSQRLIGVSCYNDLALAEEAGRGGADYVAFGAFFASTVKPGAKKANLDLLRIARPRLALPIVAIGGITPSNGRELVDAGADALAVISALWSAPDVGCATRNFINLFAGSLPT